MKRIPAWAISYVGTVLLLSVVSLLSLYLVAPYRGYSGAVVINIEPGTSTPTIARELESRGVISSKLLFLVVRALRLRTTLLAGEYRFERPMSVWKVFDTIARGLVQYHALTIPEGYNRFEIADAVAKTGLVSQQAFLKECGQATRVRMLFPEASTLEGFLFPDTYYLPRSATAWQLADMMVGKFQAVFRELARQGPTSLSPYQVVTLASMIEKETSLGHEREMISSVFHNRLRRRMLLQCDPTVIYGLILESRYRGRLHRSDLKDLHPYNTYIHAGLPPGPIANPGRAALQAAFNPAESNYLYFVAQADGTGGHVFSETLEGHLRAVVEYRQGRAR